MDDRARMIAAWRAREVPNAHTRAQMLARLQQRTFSSRTTIAAFGIAMAIAAVVLLALGGVGRLLPRRLAEHNEQAVHETTPAREHEVATPPAALPPARAEPGAIADPQPQPAPPPKPTRRAVAPTRPKAPPTDVAEEGRMLAAAQAALRDGDPARALTELGAHAKRFPTGTMASEREALRVIALCSAGRRDEGVRASTAVLADRGASSYAPRIRRACGL